jgi:hypothetical protein
MCVQDTRYTQEIPGVYGTCCTNVKLFFEN